MIGSRAPLLLTLAGLVWACSSPASIPDEDRFLPPRPAPAIVDPGRSAGVNAGPTVTEVPTAAPTTLATIAGVPIRADDLLLEWHRNAPRDVFAIMEKLVATKLAQAEAQRLGISIAPEVVEASYQEVIGRLEADIAEKGRGLSTEDFIRLELGLRPERYYQHVHEGTVRQLFVERAVRAWALTSDNGAVRLIVVQDEEQARALLAEIEAGADFAAVAREKSVDETAEVGGLLPYLVNQVHSPLARVAFTSQPGDVSGPIQAAGHWFLVMLVERREPLEGSWTEIGAAVEASLAAHPVQEGEFLRWKLEMDGRYPIDLRAFLELVGAPVVETPSR